jgi:hypothetical protein
LEINSVHLRFEDALRAADPTSALDDLAKAFKAEGMDQLTMYRLFGEYSDKTEGDDLRSNAVLDTMDLIHGGAWARGRGYFSQSVEPRDRLPDLRDDEVILARSDGTANRDDAPAWQVVVGCDGRVRRDEVPARGDAMVRHAEIAPAEVAELLETARRIGFQNFRSFYARAIEPPGNEGVWLWVRFEDEIKTVSAYRGLFDDPGDRHPDLDGFAELFDRISRLVANDVE